MKFYRGYFPLEGKTPMMKWKREVVPDDGLLTLEQVGSYSDYGAPLTEETALVDIDDADQADKLFSAITAEGVRCRVLQTDRGLHFLFSNKGKTLTKCGAHVRFAIGVVGDVKVGLTNSYEKLKSHGKVRTCIYGQDLTDTDQLDPVPAWLKVIGKEDKTPDFPNMGEGSGRNNELYNWSCNLQKRGFKKEDVRKSCELLNDFVFEEALSEYELGLVLREESMQIDPTFGDDEVEEGREALLNDLDRTDKGAVLPTIKNAVLIIKANPAFDGVRKNVLADTIEAGTGLPWPRDKNQPEWTDDDDCHLRAYMEKFSIRFTKSVVFDGLNKVATERMYHPVKDYLEGLPKWDGVERADRLLHVFLGADDTEYVRQVTRKTLCAAVRRVYEPGCKFDTLLVLNGAQGLGKSTLIRMLGGPWFGDSLLLSDVCYNGKAAAEKIQGIWIEEIAELSGLKKVDIETLRGFITRQDDYGRAAYGRRSVHRPRQCVFFGTTNAQQEGFLRDTDGNRRFWVVDVADEGGTRSVIGEDADLQKWEIDQIWAEIMVRVEEGEDLYLTDESVLAEAKRIQNKSIEADPRQSMLEEYLDAKLPSDWYTLSADARVSYFRYTDEHDKPPEGARVRQFVTYEEIWTEGFLYERRKMSRIDKNDMKAMLIRSGWVEEKKTMWIGGKTSRVFRREVVTDPSFK